MKKLHTLVMFFLSLSCLAMEEKKYSNISVTIVETGGAEKKQLTSATRTKKRLVSKIAVKAGNLYRSTPQYADLMVVGAGEQTRCFDPCGVGNVFYFPCYEVQSLNEVAAKHLTDLDRSHNEARLVIENVPFTITNLSQYREKK